MIWMLFIGVLVMMLLYILWQLELIGKTNKGLRSKLQAQELLKLQQAAYQLAEQQRTVLELQLAHPPLHPRLTTVELQLVRLLCISLPVVIKECCSKTLTPQQAMASQMKRQSSLNMAQLELMIKTHSRLTTLWQNNSVISHLQLCTVAATLAGESEPAKASSL